MKWISVKNVLPKDGIKVLTYSETTNKYGFCDCLKSYVLEYGNYDKVTHWAKLELYGNSEQLVKTNDLLVRENRKYEVVIADENVFVICPIIYDEVEKSNIVKYDKSEIYANQKSINTLEGLRFEKI
jgi:hypothetical protein